MKSALIITLGVLFANFAMAADPQGLCPEDVTSDAVVTELENGQIAICSIVPTAYMTPAQAKKAALGLNQKAAKETCAAGFSNVERPQATNYPQAVGVLSLIECH